MAIEHADFDGIERLALVTGGEIVSTFGKPELVKMLEEYASTGSDKADSKNILRDLICEEKYLVKLVVLIFRHNEDDFLKIKKDLKDKHNNTALKLAESKGNNTIITMLGGDPNALRKGAAE